MRKRDFELENVADKRMLSLREAQSYTGMGKNSCRKWLDEIGAIIKIGGRVLADKKIIDYAIDKITNEKVNQ